MYITGADHLVVGRMDGIEYWGERLSYQFSGGYRILNDGRNRAYDVYDTHACLDDLNGRLMFSSRSVVR